MAGEFEWADDAGGNEAKDVLGRSSSIERVREIYANQASRMARFAWIDRIVLGRQRRRLFGKARGRVLDVACGTGSNALYLPRDTEYVGIDASPDMLAEAAARFDHLELGESLLEMDAESLDFPDDSFDTVISSLSTCTFPDPIAALREMERVCSSDGRILLLEHGQSDIGLINRYLNWRVDAHFRKHACRWNQKPIDLVEAAGLRIRNTRTAWLGMLSTIEASPA